MIEETRRLSTPHIVRYIWNAISIIKKRKQKPTCTRISSNVSRNHEIDCEKLFQELNYAVSDDLVMQQCVEIEGVSEHAYKLTNGSIKLDKHDWYCFECHKSGKVLLCSTCHRVYHKLCVRRPPLTVPFICKICKMMNSKTFPKMKKKYLNVILSYACRSLKEKAREIHSLPCSPDDSWIYRSLVYQKIDLNTMEEKITMKLYKNLAEFYCDVLSVVHNVIVMYGGESSLASLARQILEDCAYDMKEIRQCHRCYKISNEKQHKFWFCEPCDPPHELVWAKQKKFAFWPAKVIQKHDNYYDVRFFGGLHQRAVVSEACVKPIATSLYQLRIKKTSTFKKALKELYYHQRLLHLKKRKSKCSSPSVSKLDIRTKLSTENVMELKPTIEEELLVPQKLLSPVVHQLPQCSSSSSRNNKERQVTKGHCDCSVKYNEILKEFQRRIEEEYKVKEKRALKALADKMTKDFEEEKKNIIATALDQFHQEVEHSRFQLEHQLLYQHQQELQNLLDFHQQELLDVKRKQWCTICQIEAKYQCCWNTYYCSVECQYKHWEEHKWTCQKNASTDHKTDC